jgi:hypothetical protein
MATGVPAHHRSQLAGYLAIDGIRMTDDPDDRAVHHIHHQGADWTAAYWGHLEGEPIWHLTGPAHPDGIDLDVIGIHGAITKHQPERTTMPDTRNPADVCNPITDLSDYDFLEFVSFVWKVKQEGSYSEENYGPDFEAPAMQAIADDPKQLRAFYRANLKAVQSWWDTVGGENAVDLHNAHVDEQRKREEDARLWGIRCTDGYVITCDTRESRDGQVAYMNENRGKGWREPAALLQRFAPGAAWNETRLTL